MLRWCRFYLLGGFVYFDGEPGKDGAMPHIVAINALSLSGHAPGELFFDGPYAAPPEAVNAMRRTNRLCRVTVERLKRAGIAECTQAKGRTAATATHLQAADAVTRRRARVLA